MREYTLGEFTRNMDRARSLMATYSYLTQPGQGRRSVKAADSLRASVVFLHSALEEFIRNAFLWRLPLAESDALDGIPLKGISPTYRPQPFLLGKLAPFRGLFVENVLRESIEAYVDHMNISSVNEVARCLQMIGLKSDDYASHFALLAEMISRRHQIVHQMDRNKAHGTGHQRAASISLARVEAWEVNLKGFVHAAVADIPD